MNEDKPYQIEESLVEAVRREQPSWLTGKRQQFKIIIPLRVYAAAAKLSPTAAVLLGLLYLEAQLDRRAVVVLPQGMLDICGIGRRAELAALRLLESHQIIRVHQKRGARPVVVIRALMSGLEELLTARRRARGPDVRSELDEDTELPEELINGLIVKPERKNGQE
jgi:hypothetical protein